MAGVAPARVPVAGLHRRRRAVVVIAIALVALVVLVAWAVVANRRASSRTVDEIASLRHRRTELERRTVATRARVARLERELAARTEELGSTSTALAAVDAQLGQVHDLLQRAGVDLAAQLAATPPLRACLDGVSAALNALSVGDTTSALEAVGNVGPACEST